MKPSPASTSSATLTDVELVPTPPREARARREVFDLPLPGGARVEIEATAKDRRTLARKLEAVEKQRTKLERKPLKKRLTAKRADRHELYQLSVQSPEEDIKFLRRVYKSLRKKHAVHFREDFSGTHLLATEWVRTRAGCTAEGFDNDPDPVAWGLYMNARRLGEDTARLRLSIADVREPSHTPPDVRCAQNFSYWCFHKRSELVEYFRSVREDLAEGGVFVLDLHGGSETQEEMEEEREITEGFTYVWDQHSYWPIPGRAVNHIHFRFEDGTEMYRAFTYDWRLWGLPELRDCLEDAGFASVTTYWEGTDADGESGNGVFKPAKRGEADLSWIAYLAAAK
jgi:SAM-dependent methyltransferase